ncbi:MAG: AraC family transcriptional regulator [Bacteroidaceae bacterium]
MVVDSVLKKATHQTNIKRCDVHFAHEHYLRGVHHPAEKCDKNQMLFVLSGELLINSYLYPSETLTDRKVILQPIGSKVEYLALVDTDFLIFEFNDIPLVNEEAYSNMMQNNEAPITYPSLDMPNQVYICVDQICSLLSEAQEHDYLYAELKAKELIYLMIRYINVHELRKFFYTIGSYTDSFQHFIMSNFRKVKNVEDFAHLGGYNLSTFRRIFKNVYGMAVYEWILDKKREGIINDLQHTSDRINVISSRYGFDSLSHFAHFCKSSFGDTPRSLRKRSANDEEIKSLLVLTDPIFPDEPDEIDGTIFTPIRDKEEDDFSPLHSSCR